MMKYITRQDVKYALLVGVPLAFVTAFAFHFGVTYHQELGIPNMPMDEWFSLPFQQQQKLLETQQAFRVISGYEKIIYLLREFPMTFIYYWLILAIPMFMAIIFGAWSVRRLEPNPSIKRDA